MSVSSYSVGNRVYNGGSSMPTMGTVDPMGYIERELNKMASQTRSGLAEAALRRMGQVQQAPAQQQAAPDQGAYGLQSQSITSGPVKTMGGGGTGGLPPILRVSNVGKLTAPDIAGVSNGFQPSFDPDEAEAEMGLKLAKNRFESDYGQGQYDVERDYGMKQRDVNQEIPVNQRRLLEDYAGRGMAFSSGYGYDRGELDNQYAKMLGDLGQNRTDALQDLIRQRGLFNDEYSQKINAVQESAKRRAEKELAAALKAEMDKADALNAGVQAERDALPKVGDSQFVLPEGATDISKSFINPTTGQVTGAPAISAGGESAYISPQAPKGAWMNPATMNDASYRSGQPQPASTQMASAKWEGPIDAKSRATLAAGGTVTRGNGYVYKMSGPNGTGVPIRIR